MSWQPVADELVLRKRALMLKRIRAFFDELEVLEVETPVISSTSVTDPHIESLKTSFRGETYYLNTSPEFAMKRMLAAYGVPIYQVCHVFRDDELGVNHNPEFTMLEWYRPGFDMHLLMEEIEALMNRLFDSQLKNFEKLSYRQAFVKYAELDPHQANAGQCRRCAKRYGVEEPVGMADDLDDWLDWLLTQVVLPSLDRSGFTFIYNYPASQAALARINNDEHGVPVASRFELFYGEVELANGFHELLDHQEQKTRFEQDNQTRLLKSQPVVEMDNHLLNALEHGMPDCSGVALGLDRLLMVMTQSASIDRVMAFPWSYI